MKTKNPIVNATLAALYIVLIVNIINVVTGITQEGDGEEFLIIPIAMLSLFVISAAVMGLLFIYEPLKMHLDGHREQAVAFFLKTLGVFVGYLIVFLIIILYTFR